MSNINLYQKIDDILIFKYNRFEDQRGFFSEIYVNNIIDQHIDGFDISQINFSKSAKNVARGLHLQIEPKMGKLMRLIEGKAIFFAFDCRKSNFKFKKLHILNLDNKSSLLIWAPYYYARGFISLKENTLIEYLCTSNYNPKSEYSIDLFDSHLRHSFNKKDFKQSQKDKNAISVNEWFSLNLDL